MNYKNFKRLRVHSVAVWILGLTLFASFNGLQAQEDAKAISIRWQPVARAIGYQIQVRDEGGTVVADQLVRATVFEPQLKPGRYFYRVSALGPGNKPGQFSPWLQVNVLPTRVPEIGRIEPKEDTPQGRRIQITGQGFQSESKAFLVRGDGTRLELPVELVDESTLSVFVPPGQADGAYDIEVENPRGLKKEREDVIQIAGGEVSVDRSAKRAPAPGRKEAGASEGDNAGTQAGPDTVRPAPEPGEQLEALWRSALLPGWGQYYQGRTGMAAGVLVGQAALYRSTFLRTRTARQAAATHRTLVRQNLYIQNYDLTRMDQRDDFYLWRRIAEVRSREFDARLVDREANTSGSIAAAFYLWNLLDVSLYAGEGEDQVGRGGALWRSAVLPGWGQYASGRPLAGAAYSGAFFVSVAAALTGSATEREMRAYHNKNENERTWLLEVTSARAAGNDHLLFSYRESALERRRLHELRREAHGAIGMAGLVYAASLADLFVPWEALGGANEGAGLYIGPTADGPALGLMLRF